MSIEQQAGLLLVYMQVQQIQIAADDARLVLQRHAWRKSQRRRMRWVWPWLEAARRFSQTLKQSNVFHPPLKASNSEFQSLINHHIELRSNPIERVVNS